MSRMQLAHHAQVQMRRGAIRALKVAEQQVPPSGHHVNQDMARRATPESAVRMRLGADRRSGLRGARWLTSSVNAVEDFVAGRSSEAGVKTLHEATPGARAELDKAYSGDRPSRRSP